MNLHGIRLCRTNSGLAWVYTVDVDGCPMRVLKVGGVYQSATFFGERRFDLPFEYMRAFDRMFDAERCGFQVRRILAIGGGGCSYPKYLAATRPDVKVDVVERDGRIARLARKYFFAGELEDAGRLSIVVDDGVDFLMSDGESYDAIVVDAFDGREFDGRFLNAGTLGAVKGRLTQGGMYVLNVVCDEGPEDAAELHRIMQALAGAFAHVNAVFATDEQLSDRDNFVVIATDGDYSFEGAFSLIEG